MDATTVAQAGAQPGDTITTRFVRELSRVDRARWFVLVSRLIRSMEEGGADARVLAIHRGVRDRLQRELAQ